MYESPINIITSELSKAFIEAFDGEVLKAVMQTDIDVTREELVKALAYDRGQYTKGYEDGYADGQNAARADLTFCKDCEEWSYPYSAKGFNGNAQAGFCELNKWLCGEQGYCMYGREREE